jgi:hypothetical protein
MNIDIDSIQLGVISMRPARMSAAKRASASASSWKREAASLPVETVCCAARTELTTMR